MENIAQDKPSQAKPSQANPLYSKYNRAIIYQREREREKNTGKHDHLKTPANMNGTTTSPWRAKIQRIGLLNMIYILTARARLANPAN